MKATPAFLLARVRGMSTVPVSGHPTRAAAEAAMRKKTGGFGPDSLSTGGYLILDVGPRGPWQYIPAGDFPAVLRPRS